MKIYISNKCLHLSNSNNLTNEQMLNLINDVYFRKQNKKLFWKSLVIHWTFVLSLCFSFAIYNLVFVLYQFLIPNLPKVGAIIIASINFVISLILFIFQIRFNIKANFMMYQLFYKRSKFLMFLSMLNEVANVPEDVFMTIEETKKTMEEFIKLKKVRFVGTDKPKGDIAIFSRFSKRMIVFAYAIPLIFFGSGIGGNLAFVFFNLVR